jgi:urease accessory protein
MHGSTSGNSVAGAELGSDTAPLLKIWSAGAVISGKMPSWRWHQPCNVAGKCRLRSSVPAPGAWIDCGMDGSLDIRFAAAESGPSRLVHLDQRAPLRALFPHCPNMGLPVAAITATCGGFVGGDSLRVALELGDGAALMAIGQSAEKLYRSTGAETRIDATFSLGRDAWLEYLPQETIIFDGARLRRHTRVNMGEASGLLAGEILAFGRQARGENLTHGLIHDSWSIQREGRLAWSDSFHGVDADLADLLDHPAALDGARASAMLIHAGGDLVAALAFVRSRLAALNTGLRVAATIVNDVLLVRWLAKMAADIRPAFAAIWTGLRSLARGLPPQLPTFWHV